MYMLLTKVEKKTQKYLQITPISCTFLLKPRLSMVDSETPVEG